MSNLDNVTDLTARMEERSAGVARRTVIKGAAWSLPVVAVVMATPAMAASGTPATIVLTNAGGTDLSLGVLDPVIGADVALFGSGPNAIVITAGTAGIAPGATFTVSVTQTGGITELGLPLYVQSLGSPATNVSGLGTPVATFQLDGGLAAGAPALVPIAFHYEPGTVGVSVQPSYTVDVSLDSGGEGTGTVTALAAIGVGDIEP